MSKATFTLGALAGAMSIAGVVLGSVALAKVESSTPVAAPSTVTVTATPESGHGFWLRRTRRRRRGLCRR